MKINIAITIGDAGGVGPEIAVKTALDSDIIQICQPVLIGPESVIRRAIDKFAPKAILKSIKDFEGEQSCIAFDDFNELQIESYPDGISSAEAGLAAYKGVELATKAVISGKYDAIVTAPISKESVNLAGIEFQGHTEFVAALSGVEDFCMMQSDGPLESKFCDLSYSHQ